MYEVNVPRPGAYVSVAARARDTSLQLDWVQAFGQMRSLCADPSTSTSTDTLPRLLELRRRVAPAERSFGCCGLDAPDDYTARLCPELKQVSIRVQPGDSGAERRLIPLGFTLTDIHEVKSEF